MDNKILEKIITELLLRKTLIFLPKAVISEMCGWLEMRNLLPLKNTTASVNGIIFVVILSNLNMF